MESLQNDIWLEQGGPAFPCTSNAEGITYKGISVRDYFAAKALAALIGYETKDEYNRGKKAVPMLAAYAYEYADAMLKEREKSKP